MNLIDCNNLHVDYSKTYGGATGSKIAVWYNNELYMLKTQQKLKERNLRNVEISYANDPVTEYIGSHIYALLNVPVHQTLLGTYRGKLCVLCKDVAYHGSITEFRSLRNTLMEDDLIQHSSGMSSKLSDIVEVISKFPKIDKEACLYRFWIMFAIDALIGNTDRNNGNWGFKAGNDKYLLYPVYDCGGCLNNKRSEAQMRNDLATGEIKHMALATTFNFQYDNGKRVDPYKYMSSCMNPYLQFGVNLVSTINMYVVNALIESVKPIITDTAAEYYRVLTQTRFTEICKYVKH